MPAALPERSSPYLVSLQIYASRWGEVSQGRLYSSPEITARKKETYTVIRAGRCSAARNDAGTAKENPHKIRTKCSATVHASARPNCSDAVEKKNYPGALAGATGAKFEVGHFRTKEYQTRAESATALCLAIAECHRDEAVVILSAALADLSAGYPLPIWMHALDDARWWAGCASEIERKAWCLACFEAMAPSSRSAFLKRVGGNHV